MGSEAENTILVDQLQVGVYVYLDVGWMHHPFSFNNFKIRDEAQLQTIRELGLKFVRWDPQRSNTKPLAQSQATPPDQAAALAPDAGITPPAKDNALMLAKMARIEALNEHRAKLNKVEQAFSNAANVIRGINKTIYSQPEKTLEDAGRLISEMVDIMLAAPELAIQVMAEKPGSDDMYFHSLNVSVLSMTLAKELALPAEICAQVYEQEGYEGSVETFSQVSLDSEVVFADDGRESQLATVTGDVRSGYTVTLPVRIDTTTTPTGGGMGGDGAPSGAPGGGPGGAPPSR